MEATLTFEQIAGPVALREYEQAAEYAQPELREWIMSLPTLDARQFLDAAIDAINASAVMGYDPAYRARSSAAWWEDRRRRVAAGGDPQCTAPRCSAYSAAHRLAMRDAGLSSPEAPCTCADRAA